MLLLALLLSIARAANVTTTTSCTPRGLTLTLFDYTHGTRWQFWSPSTVNDSQWYQSASTSPATTLGACGATNQTLCIFPSATPADNPFVAAYTMLPNYTAAGVGQYSEYVLTYYFFYTDDNVMERHAFGLAHYAGLDSAATANDTPSAATFGYYSGGLQTNFVYNNTDTYWPVLLNSWLRPPYAWCADFDYNERSTPPCHYVTVPGYKRPVRDETLFVTVVLRYAPDNASTWVHSSQIAFSNGSLLLADSGSPPAWSTAPAPRPPTRLLLLSLFSSMLVYDLVLKHTVYGCAADATATTPGTSIVGSTAAATGTTGSPLVDQATPAPRAPPTPEIFPVVCCNCVSANVYTIGYPTCVPYQIEQSCQFACANIVSSFIGIVSESSCADATCTNLPVPTPAPAPRTSTSTHSPPTSTGLPDLLSTAPIASSTRVDFKLIAALALTALAILCCFVVCFAMRKRVRATRVWHLCCSGPLRPQDTDDDSGIRAYLTAPIKEAATTALPVAKPVVSIELRNLKVPVVAGTELLSASGNVYSVIPQVVDGKEIGRHAAMPPPPPRYMPVVTRPEVLYDHISLPSPRTANAYDSVSQPLN
jgi:hypothetical protein